MNTTRALANVSKRKDIAHALAKMAAMANALVVSGHWRERPDLELPILEQLQLDIQLVHLDLDAVISEVKRELGE